MTAYLTMMAPRLVELQRILKRTGSLYLHCDPTASHYLKLILDTIFGPENFRAEIIWKRTGAHNDSKQGARQPGRIHDVIFFYTKSADWVRNPNYVPYDEDYIAKSYNKVEKETGRRFKASDLTAAKPIGNTSYSWRGHTPPAGRYWAYSLENMQAFEAEGRIYYSRTGMPYLKHYLDEMPGIHIQSIWDDIPPISGSSKERLGYPTQKPVKLLERIIESSSKVGDVVLDPFCGCGTAISAAQKLGRAWIGIDIAALSIAVIKVRLYDEYELREKRDYEVLGEPVSVADAQRLAQADRYQFQWWALSLVQARPQGADVLGKGKKGKDRGIDGIINFIDKVEGSPRRQKVIVQVKSGKVTSADIRDLRGVLDREKAPIGLFITLEAPTKGILEEADSAGLYQSELYGTRHPRLQILTIEDLLEKGAKANMPPQFGTFTKAERQIILPASQSDLF